MFDRHGEMSSGAIVALLATIAAITIFALASLGKALYRWTAKRSAKK